MERIRQGAFSFTNHAVAQQNCRSNEGDPTSHVDTVKVGPPKGRVISPSVEPAYHDLLRRSQLKPSVLATRWASDKPLDPPPSLLSPAGSSALLRRPPLFSMMRFFLALLFFVIGARGFVPHPSSRATPRSSTQSSSGGDSDLLTKPKWAGGGDPLSSFVNALIGFKPLFGLMKIAARKTLISTAEENGIPWSERAAELTSLQSQLESYKAGCESPTLTYPTYFLQPFHAYSEGNTNWLAAVEVESATMSMALRVWPKEELTATEAQDRLRYSFLDTVRAYMARHCGTSATLSGAILDVGCSVGMSTFYLARYFPDAREIMGLDLSAHFLAVAQYRQAEQAASNQDKLSRITWKHAAMEDSGLPSDSFALTTASFMYHELPQKESRQILREMYRVTERGGVIAITDNNPRSPVIQSLPPVLFTLMKSTEPWSDEYYTFDLESAVEQAGFELVETVASDPRHRTVCAIKR